MSSASGDDFKEIFAVRSDRTGMLTSFSLSSDGFSILVTTLDQLLVIDTRIGMTSVNVNVGTARAITAATWMSSQLSILGCRDGHMYFSEFRPSSLFGSQSVTITYAFRDVNKRNTMLRYDIPQGLLGIAYEDGVSIWQHTNAKWRLVDRIPVAIEGNMGVTSIEFFGEPERRLFIGGTFGHIIWHGAGRVDFFTGPRRICLIGAAALSDDRKHLVISSFNRQLHIWGAASKSINPRGSVHDFESGHEYHNLSPRIPVAMTASGLAVLGSQVGLVAFVRSNGVTASEFFYEPNFSVMGILSHENRLYVAFLGPVGSIIIVGYSNKVRARRTFRDLRKQHSGLIDTKSINIPLNQVPRPVPTCPHNRAIRVASNRNSEELSRVGYAL
ncbi:putative transmembrane protein, partial [Rhizoctonia solani 123E]